MSIWYTNNSLKCNPNKTNHIYLSSKYKYNPMVPRLVSESHDLIPSDVFLNLGVKFDKHLLFKERISNIRRGTSLSISRISKLGKYLDVKTSEQLIHAFVSSKLDCCNSLLYGLPSHEIARLQKFRLQQHASLLSRRCDNISHLNFETYTGSLSRREFNSRNVY